MASEKWEYGFVYFVSTQSEEQRQLRNHPDRSRRALEYGLAAVVVDGSIRSQAVPGKVALLGRARRRRLAGRERHEPGLVAAELAARGGTVGGRGLTAGRGDRALHATAPGAQRLTSEARAGINN
ncbi:hypothetical protein [Dactylosporangium sp. CA-233914]|uniref:hypothetical protein n=1 Tax=Dactylosporangium sp. CA-233914 TaxID=3239934 RepID=UPI003D92B754